MVRQGRLKRRSWMTYGLRTVLLVDRATALSCLCDTKESSQ
jgi:hypothetical protein